MVCNFDATLLHNHSMTGSFSIDQTKLITLLNLRPLIKIPYNFYNLGNCFASIIHDMGKVDLNEKLIDITARLRNSFNEEFRNKSHFKIMKHDLQDPSEYPERPLLGSQNCFVKCWSY